MSSKLSIETEIAFLMDEYKAMLVGVHPIATLSPAGKIRGGNKILE